MPDESADPQDPVQGDERAPDLSAYITVTEAATILGVARQNVLKAIGRGSLPTTVVLGRHLIRRDALARYQSRTQPDGEKPRGRPREQG